MITLPRPRPFVARAAWSARIGLAVGAVFLLGAGAAQVERPRGTSPLEAGEDKVITVASAVDPHGAADGCAECHATDGSGALDPSPPPMAACERCHPQTNFHLVGVEPEEVDVPPVMRLFGGQVTCATCHDEPACDGLPRDARGTDHFRDGPFPSNLALCFACHEREAYQQTDPHRDLRTPDGERNDAVCVFCHQGVPTSETDERVQTLRVDPVELCKGCHAHQIHVGIPSHLVIAPPEMVARVGAYNETQEYPIPLGPGGEISCSTCHDPHPGLDPFPLSTSPARLEALRKANRAYRDRYYLPRLRHELERIVDVDGQPLLLADGPRNKDGLLRVPAEDGAMCLICHELGDGP